MRWRATWTWVAVAGLCGCAANGPRAPERAVAPVEQFDVDAYVAGLYFQWNPEIASAYGVGADRAGDGFAARLNPRSPDAEAGRRDAFRALRTELERTPAGESEDALELRANYAAMIRGGLAPADVVEYGTVFSDWGMWYVPYAVSQLSGPQDAIPKMLTTQHQVKVARDAEDYLSRMTGYGTAVDEIIEKILHDRALGVVPPAFIIDRSLEALQAREIGDASRHPMVLALEQKAHDAGLDSPDALGQRAATLIHDVVQPANMRLAATLQSLRSEAGPEAGIWRLPQGEALYRALILHMTDTEHTPEEIHALGLAEVERVVAEMDAILRAEGHASGSVGERMTSLAGESRFLYPNDEAGRARLLEDIRGQMQEATNLLPRWFAALPRHHVEVRAVPPHDEGGSTGAYYTAPSLDGTRPGTYWIHLSDTAHWPSFKLKTLTYHEAVPGHHLQVAMGLREDAPLMVNVLFSNAFGEGWALYAEALAYEMGLYRDDPFGNLGRLQDELWRAMRLVVDTGLHSKRWTREQAIGYMIATSGTHPDEATAEVERYVVWPAQALGYKIGMLEIQRLRREAESALGARFELRDFHDEVLRNGGVPLQLMQRRIERWIHSRKVAR